MDELEKALLKFFEMQGDEWTWKFGSKIYTKKETIELFKKNKKFRKFVKEQAVLLAIDLFTRGAGLEGSAGGANV